MMAGRAGFVCVILCVCAVIPTSARSSAVRAMPSFECKPVPSSPDKKQFEAKCGDYQYTLHLEAAQTWWGALETCNKKFGYLAKLEDDKEIIPFTITNQIKELADMNDFPGDVWTGLENLERRGSRGDGGEWRWLEDHAKLKDVKLWATGFPKVHAATKDAQDLCATLSEAGNTRSLKNVHCDKKHAFVCRRKIGDNKPIVPEPPVEQPGSCPTGFVGLPGLNKCLKVVTSSKANGYSWADAATKCRHLLDLGGDWHTDLASIVTPLEQALMTSQIQSASLGYWIGGYAEPCTTSETCQNDMLWIDNAPLKYHYWANEEPKVPSQKLRCVEAIYSPEQGRWSWQGCEGKRGYVCQAFKYENSPVPPPPEKTCDPEWTPYGGHCFKLLHENNYTNQHDANVACQSLRADSFLTSVHSRAEGAALEAVARTLWQDVWIGLRDVDGLFEWNDGWPMNFGWFGAAEHQSNLNVIAQNEALVTLTPLITSAPPTEPPPPDMSCISLHGKDGYWWHEDCAKQLPAICRYTHAPKPTDPTFQEGVCPGEQEGGTDWIQPAWGNQCYHFSTTKKTWSDAHKDCVMRSATGGLVSIHSETENKWVVETMSTLTTDIYFWLGLNEVPSGENTKQWQWRDKTVIDYEWWAPEYPRQPSEGRDCVEAYSVTGWHPYHWVNVDCAYTARYVCKSPKIPMVTVPPPDQKKCPDGWSNYGEECFKVGFSEKGKADDLPKKKEFYAALALCEEEGGSLPTVTDYGSNAHILNLVRNYGDVSLSFKSNYWIGLHKPTKTVDSYQWTSGSDFDRNNHYQMWSDETTEVHRDTTIGYTEVILRDEDETGGFTGQKKGSWNFIPSPKVLKMVVCQTPAVKPKSGLSGGETAGAVIGTLLALILLAVLLLFLLQKYDIFDYSTVLPKMSGNTRLENE